MTPPETMPLRQILELGSSFPLRAPSCCSCKRSTTGVSPVCVAAVSQRARRRYKNSCVSRQVRAAQGGRTFPVCHRSRLFSEQLFNVSSEFLLLLSCFSLTRIGHFYSQCFVVIALPSHFHTPFRIDVVCMFRDSRRASTCPASSSNFSLRALRTLSSRYPIPIHFCA